MKKISKILLIITSIFILLCPISFGADNVNFKEQIKQEDGSLFEKIIAECIGGIAQTVFDFTTGETLNVGFKDYDTLIFNSNQASDSLSPFTEELWKKTMDWYKVFAIISGSLILIAVIILSYKIIMAGMNTSKKIEAKESLTRLLFGGIAISFAPLFIKFLLFMNNSLVYLLVTFANGSLEGFLGNSMLTSIKTGNAITTALVISMFIYLFVKINIKFIVRQFTIIIFTIFTPVACGLWIINKNVTAASIWIGQIMMNIFMQFIYCFLFLIYIAFLPSGGGWAVSLIWAMMILPLADALQNCLQNLTSRIAGVDNDQMSNRVIGMGAMLGFGIGAIKEQFNTPKQNTMNNTSNENTGGFKGFLNRTKSVITPGMNLSSEKDYNNNINPIRDVLPKEKQGLNTNDNAIKQYNNINKNEKLNTIKTIAGTTLKTGVKATKGYLEIGAKMAEGDFKQNPYKVKTSTMKRNFQNTEYLNNISNVNSNNEMIKKGDENEY